MLADQRKGYFRRWWKGARFFGAEQGACIFFFFAAALAIPMDLHGEPANGLGMWVWPSSAYATQEEREKLVEFCGEQGIGHIDVHIKMAWDGDKVRLRDGEAFRELILLAGRNNITTAALRGNPRMFFAENHERTCRELLAIIAFSETLPGDARFKGIKYDVEPYATEEWKAKGETREAVMRDYLAFLRKARSVLHARAPGLWLAVDTPYWWDNEEFILEFAGERKRFSEHVQDLTDFIVIMSYRRTVPEVLACVDGERKYARRIQKLIFPSLETVELKREPNLTFWGTPKEELGRVVPQLLGITKGDPAMGGVMIHCYRGLLEKLGKDRSCKPMKINPDTAMGE